MNFNKYKIIISGVVLGVLFWIIESLLHVLVFSTERDLIQHLFFLDAHEFWMRSLVIFLIVSLSVYSQIIFNKVKTNEQKLKESKEKYRYLMDGITTVGIGIDIVTKDYKVLFQNQVLKEKFGDITGKLCYENYMGLKAPCDFCPMIKALKNNTIESTELIAVDGNIYELFSAPYLDSDRTTDKVIEIVMNITERKQAEMALRESEEKFRYFFNNTQVGLFWSRISDGKFLECNDTFAKLVGYDAREECLADYIALEHYVDLNVRDEMLEEIRINNEVKDFEIQVTKRDGTSYWASISARINLKENRIEGAAIDITDRKKIQKELQFERDNLINILSSMEDGIYIVDQNYDIEYVNPILTQEFGEYEGKKCYTYFHDLNEPCPWCKNKEVFEGKTVRWEWYSFKNQKTYDLIDTPLKNVDGSISKLEIFRDITERKQMELDLKSKKAALESIFKATPTGIGVVVNRVIKQVNDQFCELVGYAREELLNKSARMVYPTDEDYEFVGKEKYAQVDTSGSGTVETRFKRKDGKIIEVILSSALINSDQPSAGITFTVLDITDRKIAEQKLKESEERYRNLVEDAQEGIWALDENENTTFVNPKICEMLGYTKNEMMGKNLDLFIPDSMKERIKGNRIRREKCIKETYNLVLLKKDGTIVYTNVKAAPIMSEDQDYKGSFAYITDVTTQKQAEDTLRESEVKYRHLFETSPYFIGLVNSEGILIDCNDTINDILSIHTIEDVIGKNFKEIFLLNVKNTHLIPIFEKFIKSIFEGVNQEAFEFLLNRSIGGHLWIHIEGTLIEIEEQKLIQFIMQDITERKRSEQLLQETIEDLAKINAELEQFTYVASHDLKEPLRMISSFAQLLENRYKDKLDEDANDFIRFITEGVVRMQDLINNLLNYSRIGKHSKDFEKVDLNEVLKDTIENLKQQINETNAEVIYDSLPRIFGDNYQLLQVFQNLISNAIKFRNIDPPLISISAKPDGKHWVFSISDNGIGIDSKDFERIFIIFQRLHKTEKYEGTGIGLAICKKIVEYHRGKIWVESEVGKGSTFYFSIPKEIDIKTK